MRKTLVAVAAAVAGLIVAFAPTAANAYPDPVITNPGGSAADGVVAPGEAFTVTGSFDGVDCNPWNATFLGEGIGSGSGPTFSVSATAPTEPGTYPLTITCTYDDGTTAPVSFNPGAVIQSTTLTYQIRVAGDAGTGSGSGSSADNGVLPKTGGPNVALLAAGGALLVAGGAVVAVRRRTAA